MRLFLLILILIVLVSGGGSGRRASRRNRKGRNPKPDGGNKDYQKESKIEKDDMEGGPAEKKEEEVVKEKEQKKEKAEDAVSHLTCKFGLEVPGKGYQRISSCKTGLNDNCVAASIGKGSTFYGCSPRYSCEALKMALPNVSSCKECEPKYDRCNDDITFD